MLPAIDRLQCSGDDRLVADGGGRSFECSSHSNSRPLPQLNSVKPECSRVYLLPFVTRPPSPCISFPYVVFTIIVLCTVRLIIVDVRFFLLSTFIACETSFGNALVCNHQSSLIIYMYTVKLWNHCTGILHMKNECESYGINLVVICSPYCSINGHCHYSSILCCIQFIN